MGRHGTIAGRKAAQDSKRAAMFTKYARAITVAAKAGGDPDYNPGLRVAIDKAKAISMPNDNINRAIKKGTGELAGETYEELSFEGYGLGGVAVIVEALTDNKNRTTSSVRSTFDKYGGNPIIFFNFLISSSFGVASIDGTYSTSDSRIS